MMMGIKFKIMRSFKFMGGICEIGIQTTQRLGLIHIILMGEILCIYLPFVGRF